MLTLNGQRTGQAIGFHTRESERKKVVNNNVNDILLTFDNGETISFADASHNMIVLGTTGSGKTTQVILPALNSLIRAGFGGVVIDVKGNVANHVRMLARECGRECDVVEFGPGPDATVINLFSGKTSFEREQLFRNLFCNKFDRNEYHGSGNSIFYEEGVRKAIDCLDLYITLQNKLGRKFNFNVFNRMINDVDFTKDMNAYYMKNYYDKKNFDEYALVTRITGDNIHYILPPIGGDKIKSSKAYSEQNAYRMSYIRTGVNQYLAMPGVVENFLGSANENIDMKRRIYDEKKIVILRLAPETGACGDTLARYIMREYYHAVFRNGKNLPAGQYTFCVADEFQDFYSSSSYDAYNDNSFVAKCREFKNIAIYGSQSIAAMDSRASSLSDSAAFLGNCNVRVFLYSDDKRTMGLAPENLGDLDMLESGNGYLTKFDVQSRQHLVGHVNMQKLHDEMQKVLERQTPFVNDSVPVDMADMPVEQKQSLYKVFMEECEYYVGKRGSGKVVSTNALGEYIREINDTITEMVNNGIRNKKGREIMEYASAVRKQIHDILMDGVEYRLPRIGEVLAGSFVDSDDDDDDDEKISEDTKDTEAVESKSTMSIKEMFDKHMETCGDDRQMRKKAAIDFVVGMFPEFFRLDMEKRNQLPEGWVESLCTTLMIYRSLGMHTVITRMYPSFHRGFRTSFKLILECPEGYEDKMDFLWHEMNEFTSKHCMYCGKDNTRGKYWCDSHMDDIIQDAAVRANVA